MALPPTDDTIAAIATAPGAAAIGIVRVSGPGAFGLAERLFRAASGRPVGDAPGGRSIFGVVTDGGGSRIDEGVLVTFRAPRSATGQDAVEFQVHGGPAVLRGVLDACIAAGARPAGPGEFTLRAFLGGRLDLAQAESVAALVTARSEAARRQASLGLAGALSRRVDAIQRDLTSAYAALVAVLDYPEEGVPEADLAPALDGSLAAIDGLLATARAGRAATEGARLALVGRPNAGKSSLLNALLGFERSIVAAEPGTTRDYLEAPLAVGSLLVTAIDTAGIRTTDDAVEASGVARAEGIAAAADLVVALVDASRPLEPYDRELVGRLDSDRTVWVASKADLGRAWSDAELGVTTIPVSSRERSGLGSLEAALERALLEDAGTSEVWVLAERHAEALRTARAAVERARSGPDDLRGLDLEEALRALASITGRTELAEDTLAEVFARFCVGK